VPSLIAELRQRIYRTYNLIVIDADAFDVGPQNLNLLGNIGIVMAQIAPKDTRPSGHFPEV
jgi:hypothetical protein